MFDSLWDENSRTADKDLASAAQNYELEEQYENESNKTDLIDDGTMNVFGFNDDMNLDDRVIIQNATDN